MIRFSFIEGYPEDREYDDIFELTDICNDYDKTAYGAPEDADAYVLAYEDDVLISMLAVFRMGATHSGRPVDELMPFTLPERRREGHFDVCLELYRSYMAEEAAVRFAVYRNELSEKVLEAYKAEFDCDELFMSLDLDTFSVDEDCQAAVIPDDSISFDFDENENTGRLSVIQGEAGFSLYSVDQAGMTMYIYGILIYDKYKRMGYGFALMKLLLSKLRELGAASAVLQVSSENIPAVKLYEKTGFQTLQTVSYFYIPCEYDG